MLKILGERGAETGVCKHLAQEAVVKTPAKVVQILFIKSVEVRPKEFKAIIFLSAEV